MLGWFFRLFTRTQPSLGDVYRYHDGTRWVRGDPTAILRRLSTDEAFDYDREAKLSCVEGSVGATASGRLIEGVRRAFELPSVRDGGLTEPKVAAVLLAFMRWLEVVKKNMLPLPVDAPSTTDTPDAPSPEAKNSDSISTPEELSPSSLSPLSPASTQ